MSFRGQLIKAGIDSNGTDISIFNGTLTLQTTNKLYFRDTGIHLYSNANGYLTITADIGIVISGGTNGLSFSGQFTASTSAHFIAIGTIAAAKALTLTGTTYLTVTNITGGGDYYLVGHYGRYTTSAAMNAGGFYGNYQRAYINHDVQDIYMQMGKLDFSAGTAVISPGQVCATMSEIDLGGSGTITVATAGGIYGHLVLFPTVDGTERDIETGPIKGVSVVWLPIRNYSSEVFLFSGNYGDDRTVDYGYHLSGSGELVNGLYIEGGGNGSITTAINIVSGALNTMTTGVKFTGAVAAACIDLSASTGVSNIILGGYGRISTSTAAGAALDIDASCAQNEGVYLRYSISSWTGIGSSFYGEYIRAQTGASATGKSLTGLEVYATAEHACGELRAIQTYAYVKGSGAKAVGPIYAVSAELTYDGSQSAQTINTEAMPLRCKIGLGNVTGAQALKVHGIQLYMFSMAGLSMLLGNGIEMKDGTETGTTTLTVGIKISIGCVTGISIAAASTMTAGVSMTGTMSGTTPRGFKTDVTGENLAYGDGYGAHEFQLTTLTTPTNHVASLTSWVNITGGTMGTGGLHIAAQNNGIWEASGATITNTKLIFGMRMSAILSDNDSNALFPLSLHVSGTDTIDAIWDCDTIANMSYTVDGTEEDGKIGAMPFAKDSGGTTYYIRLYSGAS